jgi:hypothetical protein
MPQLMLECQNCHKIFPSGLNIAAGASATLENNISRCQYCGQMTAIPNGTFKATVNGFIDILKDSKNPLEEAKEILNGLKKDNLSNVPHKDKIEKFLERNKFKIGLAMAVLTIIIELITNQPDIQISNNIIDQHFCTEYNQYIDIEINKEK